MKLEDFEKVGEQFAKDGGPYGPMAALFIGMVGEICTRLEMLDRRLGALHELLEGTIVGEGSINVFDKGRR